MLVFQFISFFKSQRKITHLWIIKPLNNHQTKQQKLSISIFPLNHPHIHTLIEQQVNIKHHTTTIIIIQINQRKVTKWKKTTTPHSLSPHFQFKQHTEIDRESEQNVPVFFLIIIIIIILIDTIFHHPAQE